MNDSEQHDPNKEQYLARAQMIANMQAQSIDGSSGSAIGSKETEEEVETPKIKQRKRVTEYAKYFTLLMLVMIFTIGGSLAVHKADMNTLYQMIEKKGKEDMLNIKSIKVKLEHEIRMQEEINRIEQANMQDQKKTKEEAPINSSANINNFSAKVKKLIKIFNSKPNFTDLATYNTWKKLGPFDLAKAIAENQIKVDERYNITE